MDYSEKDWALAGTRAADTQAGQQGTPTDHPIQSNERSAVLKRFPVMDFESENQTAGSPPSDSRRNRFNLRFAGAAQDPRFLLDASILGLDPRHRATCSMAVGLYPTSPEPKAASSLHDHDRPRNHCDSDGNDQTIADRLT